MNKKDLINFSGRILHIIYSLVVSAVFIFIVALVDCSVMSNEASAITISMEDCLCCHAESDAFYRHHTQVKNWKCKDCHNIYFEDPEPIIIPDETKDCVKCHHSASIGVANGLKHHAAEIAAEKNCSDCHVSTWIPDPGIIVMRFPSCTE